MNFITDTYFILSHRVVLPYRLPYLLFLVCLTNVNLLDRNMHECHLCPNRDSGTHLSLKAALHRYSLSD